MDDYDHFLESLNLLAERAAKPQISEAEVQRKATQMARCGYRFNAETLKLVRKYLEGGGLILGGNVGIGKTFFFQAAGIDAAVNLKVAQGWSLGEIGDALDSFCDTELLEESHRCIKGMEYEPRSVERCPYF